MLPLNVRYQTPIVTKRLMLHVAYGTGDEILRNAQLNAMLESSYDTLPSPHDQMK